MLEWLAITISGADVWRDLLSASSPPVVPRDRAFVLRDRNVLPVWYFLALGHARLVYEIPSILVFAAPSSLEDCLLLVHYRIRIQARYLLRLAA